MVLDATQGSRYNEILTKLKAFMVVTTCLKVFASIITSLHHFKTYLSWFVTVNIIWKCKLVCIKCFTCINLWQ